MRARHRTESNGVSVAVGIHLTAYALVFGLFALWLYSLLQPRVLPNPGLTAYAPPPGVVISYDMPARLLAEHGQPPPLAGRLLWLTRLRSTRLFLPSNSVKPVAPSVAARTVPRIPNM